MRKLVNNWLYGEVSQLLTGRLDSEIYASGCSRLENMYVHRQGGISRRPPLKSIKYNLGNFTRLIPFTMSAGQSFILMLTPKPNVGTADIKIDDGFNLNSFDFTNQEFATKYHSTWGNLSADSLREVRSATYYDCLYLVHKDCPLLRVRYIGTGAYKFALEFPEVKVNQDIKRYNITLSLTNYTTGGAGTYDIYVAGKKHQFARTATMTLDGFLDNICSLDYGKWTATKLNSAVIFEPSDKADKYREFKLATSQSTSAELEKAEFKLTTTTTPEFSYAFTATEDTDDTGLVFGQDDFLDMELNKQYSYASFVAVASEKLWLVVNTNPCRIYVSRPYGTSQLISPKESNDTILDFIQFQLVTTTSKQMKESSLLPVKIATDTNGNIVYRGSSQNQEMWAYSDDSITIKQEYDNAIELRQCTVEMGNLPEYEGGVPYRRVANVRAKDDSFYIYYSISSHLTKDTEVDFSKLKLNEDKDYYSDRYLHYNGDDELVSTTVTDSGSGGLQYSYFKTEDIYINSKKKYFSSPSSASFVENPTQEHIDDYYERTVIFNTEVDVYEESGQYLLSASPDPIPVDVEYDEVNGRILSMKVTNTIYCEAIPYYIYDLSTDEDVYDETTEIDKVATSSTGMELSFSTGRNDHIKWIGLFSSIMVGTESSEHVMSYGINALDMEQNKYSDFGSANSLVVNTGKDLVFLSKGNRLRLFYKDNWGIQVIEVTLTNAEIMEGEILNMVSIVEPEPAIAVLKRVATVVNNEIQYTYSIVFISVDRANGIQAFARWTFDFDVLDICVQEIDGSQRIVALVEDDGLRFTSYFDFTEKTMFADCGKKTSTTAENYLHGYRSLMIANPFDTQMQDGSITLGEAKNVSKIVFRCLNTGKIVTWYNEKDKNTTRTPICCDISGNYIGGLADHAINVNGGTTRDLMIAVESYEKEPMTLLAMAYELRVNRNG